MRHPNGKRIVAVDFETTGINHNDCAPLTLGLAWKNEDHEYETRHLKFRLFDDLYHDWSAEAALVNGIDFFTHHSKLTDTVSNMQNNQNDKADWFVFNNLRELSDRTNGIIPVGWNVYGFDMRFMLHYFPKSAAMFYYSSLGELNTMCSVMDMLLGREANRTKSLVKTRATHSIENNYKSIHEKGAHHAEYDALHSLMVYEKLTQDINRVALELSL